MLGPQTLAVGIGVQRGGTSWLFRALEEHPQVVGVRRGNNKELDFFTAWWDRGEAAYAALFSDRAPVGLEFSVSYFSSEDATRRLHAMRPDARILVSLRDPVERALSQHHFFQARGLCETTFDQALATNSSYVEQSRYGTHLERWIRAFGRDQVHVSRLDDIRVDPNGVVKGACEFLGLHAHAPSVGGSQINAPDRPERRWLREVMGWTSFGLRRVGGARALEVAERTRIPDRLRERVRRSAVPRLTAAEQAAAERLREDLAPEVRQAAELTGLDLSAWLPS